MKPDLPTTARSIPLKQDCEKRERNKERERKKRA